MRASARQPLRREENRFYRQLVDFVREYAPASSGFTLTEGVNEDLLESVAQAMARRMVTGVVQVTGRSWRAAARESFEGKRIYQALQTEMGSPVGQRVDELIRQQTKLIAGLPADLSLRVARYVGAQQRAGLRASQIVEQLRTRLPSLAKSQVATLARTEVGRAETALTRARSERLGLPWYEWATSEDKRVRRSHRFMDKILVPWADAPAPEMLAGEGPSRFGHYHPAQVPNCRCVALPLVSLDEVRWPHKVYEHGAVTLQTRREFDRYHGDQAA